MPMYLISYDLRKARNYQPLYDAFAQWKAQRLLQSVWLADLVGPAIAVRDVLRPCIDNDDALAVIEMKSDFDWATVRAQLGGQSWLQTHSP